MFTSVGLTLPLRRSALALALALGLALLPTATGASGTATATCPSAEPAPLTFAERTYIDRSRAGGEPVSVVAHDGSIVVSAHAGTTHLYKNPSAAPGVGDFAGSYYNQTLNWRSTDGGATWRYIGLAGRDVGPHSPTSTGFSDPDLTIDAAGRIYNVEIDLANIGVFSSTDDGQSFPFATPFAAAGDRPWLTGRGPDEVFLYVNLPHQLWRSTDGGLIFRLVTDAFPVGGKLHPDPLNPKNGLIGPLRGGGVAISDDDGRTWESYPAPLGRSTQFFPAIAVDRAGWIYAVAAGGYGTREPDGVVTFNYFNRETKQWLPEPIRIETPPGDALWPWIAAGDDGRVALVWYQTLAAAPNDFLIYAASTINAHGSVVECSDGFSREVPPRFSVANASGAPIHSGSICLRGTACNTDIGAGGDRRLGDFFTVNFDSDGRIFIVSGDTSLANPLGGPKPVANPIFIGQSGGDRLLLRPDRIRATRCLFPFPSC